MQRRPFIPPSRDSTRVNEMIRVHEVRVVDNEGKQLGILPTQTAIGIAKERGLDLIEVSPNSAPPVCRIMDYGKYKYENSKKAKASKAKQHVIKVKEIKFHPKTGENDYNYRLVQAREFLEKGFKVKATVVFRGREMVHMEFGSRWLTKMTKDLEGIGVAETNSQVDGRNVTMIFAPTKAAAAAAKANAAKKPEAPAQPGPKPAASKEKPAEVPEDLAVEQKSEV